MKEKGKLKFLPTVFAVGNEYTIVCVSDTPLLLGVEVDGKRFYDHSNGVIRCNRRAHKVTLPASLLNGAEKYTVFYREVFQRLGDFTKTSDEQRLEFVFQPIKEGDEVNIYQISDAHQKEDFPHRAAKFFDDRLNLIVINGDTFDYLNEDKDFDYLFALLEEVAEGKLPVVFAKGNHDNKGIKAEELEYYVPTRQGKTYYTFRLGGIWGLVLDCGENCVDESPEYGNTVCHHPMRLEETEYIKEVIKNADKEYNAPGVTTRVIISHCAITNVRCKPFDIEIDIYSEWVKLINERIKPHFMMSGHLHITKLCLPGDELDTLGQSCPVIIGANPVGWQTGKLSDFIGLGITLKERKAEVFFTDSSKKIVERHEFAL